MKKMIIAVFLSLAASVPAGEQDYLRGTNTIELVKGESLTVLGFYREGECVYITSINLRLVFPPYNTPNPNCVAFRVSESSDLASRTILGPCIISKESPAETFAYKKSAGDVFTSPMNVVMVPAGYDSDVDLMVESSTDLENWTPIYSGNTGTTNSSAFFRTRLITK